MMSGMGSTKIARDTIGTDLVSTVRLNPLMLIFGDDMKELVEKPFETMVFANGDTRADELRRERYATEAEALEGHARVVAELRAAAGKAVANE